MGNARPDKIFGRYNELVLLILGFVLTTLLGSYLTGRYQDRARQDAERSNRLGIELARAASVSEEVSRMLDRRLYRTRVLVWTLKDKADQSEVAAARGEYRKMLAEWNENLNRLYSTVEYSFGVKLRYALETRIVDRFIKIHQAVDACLRASGSCDPAELDAELNRFNPEIYAFDRDLLDAIRNGTVGSFLVSDNVKLP